MTFDEALKHLRAGATIRRLSWKGHVIGISIRPGRTVPNYRKTGQPFVALRCLRDDDRVQATRWAPYAVDFSADDWLIVDVDTPKPAHQRFDVRPGEAGRRCACCYHFDQRDKCGRTLSMVTPDEVCDGFELVETR